MNTFGSKEPWMEPMNAFLTNHRQEFKNFVDDICDISSERATSAIPPSYATPITILSRLPGTSREGFPSLPYRIDQARECANLVDVWLDARYEYESGMEWGQELKKFDALCEASREKSKLCLTRAEQAERPSGILEPKWEELVEQMGRKARFRETNGHSSSNTPTREGSSRTVNSSASSLADGYFSHSHAVRSSPAPSRFTMTRSPHSPLSPDYPNTDDTGSEIAETPPGSSSGVWDPGVPVSPLENGLHHPSEIDESDIDIENNSDLVGSSIYSLTSTNSKRDSAATAKGVPVSTPIKSHGHRKGPRSAYSLRHSSERADISKSITKSTGTSKPASRDGKAEKPGPVRSLYRLNTNSASQQSMDTVSSTPKSPGSRDGKGEKEGFFRRGVLRKKTKDRERDD